MGKYITLGKCSILYKYIWYYILFQIIYDYLFDYNLPNELKLSYLRPENYPKNILVQEGFNYLGTFIFSILFYSYEISKIKRKRKSQEISELNYSFISKSSIDIKLIYNDYEKGLVSPLYINLIIILLTISAQLMNTFFIINLNGLNFWMFEVLFISYLSFNIFDVPIYKHKKLAICFIMFFPSIFKSLSVVEIFKNDYEQRIYKNYIWFIPIGVISFLLITCIRDYSICKIKWLIDYKYISPNRLIITYGIVGSLICFIASIFTTIIKCVDKNTFKNIDLICNAHLKVENEEIFYYDHFLFYFKDIWRENRNNFIYIILIIIKIFLFFMVKLFSILIIKNLDQVFFICSTSIYYFIIRTLKLFTSLFIEVKNLKIQLYEVLAEFFSFLGIIVYLELIELNFWKLNYNLKRTISNRSKNESRMSSICSEEDIIEEDQRNTDLDELTPNN